MKDDDAFIVALARTPFGRFGGALKDIAASRLAATAMSETLARSGVSATSLDAIYAGVGMIGASVLTPTRQALFLADGIPDTVPSLTVDRACCSGMTAVGLAFKDIRLALADAVLCGGFESLSSTPFLWPRQRGAKPGGVDVRDPLLLRADFLDKAIATYTGEEALLAGVDRAQQDEWALASHRRYFAAEAEGYFDFERFAYAEDDTTLLTSDESPRADTSLAKLEKLKPVYGSPTVTPGNAPGLNDGAAFLLVVSGRFAKAHGLKVLARIVDYAQVAAGPTRGTSTPGVAIGKLLSRNGAKPLDLRLIEINEAFAATPLVSTLTLAEGNLQTAEALRDRTNRHGGAVAIGHPLGASGARLVATLVNGLRRDGGGLGAAAICGGYGQGDAMLVAIE
jgi:acetyl-CoA C-acetyltransferase